MTYSENPHPHQSSRLKFLPPDYTTIKFSEEGVKTFGVITFAEGEWKVIYQHRLPAFGGYLSPEENIYGSPTYCPNATRHHLKHYEIYGAMPHLVYFDSEDTAKAAGFRKCKIYLPQT